jgi:hypothetical protein
METLTPANRRDHHDEDEGRQRDYRSRVTSQAAQRGTYGRERAFEIVLFLRLQIERRLTYECAWPRARWMPVGWKVRRLVLGTLIGHHAAALLARQLGRARGSALIVAAPLLAVNQ